MKSCFPVHGFRLYMGRYFWVATFGAPYGGFASRREP
jgi:hypothetical protein